VDLRQIKVGGGEGRLREDVDLRQNKVGGGGRLRVIGLGRQGFGLLKMVIDRKEDRVE